MTAKLRCGRSEIPEENTLGLSGVRWTPEAGLVVDAHEADRCYVTQVAQHGCRSKRIRQGKVPPMRKPFLSTSADNNFNEPTVATSAKPNRWLQRRTSSLMTYTKLQVDQWRCRSNGFCCARMTIVERVSLHAMCVLSLRRSHFLYVS